MLLSLRIQNFALIDRLEIEFQPGLNVLTGETGAGKSILLDALDLLLGGKVDGRVLRQGAQQGSIEGMFRAEGTILDWLDQQAIAPLEEDTVVCVREFSQSGKGMRTRTRINGVLVNLPLLSSLRTRLVEITAQGQTQQLLEPIQQRERLDSFGGSPLLKQRDRVAGAYRQFTQAQQALAERQQSEQTRLQRLDFLQYQLQELHDAALTTTEEWDDLLQEQEKLSHVVDLQQLSFQVTQALYQSEHDTPVATDLLVEAERQLQAMTDFDPALQPCLEMVQGALTQAIEAAQQVQRYGDSLDADPQRLAEIDERLAVLKRICRKYGPNLAEAIATQEALQTEYEQLTDNGQSLEMLQGAVETAAQTLTQACGQLTQYRQKAAQKLEKVLVKELKPLAMEKVVFTCQLEAIAPGSHGAEQVVFYFSPNPGEKIQPLAKTASGGEMSRFLLALKACFTTIAPPSQTLVFDEIDVGVSGKVAQAIADKLAQLSQTQQVLCVTHQPLVAALAQAHFHVDKISIQETLPESVPATSEKKRRSRSRPVTGERTVVRVQPLLSNGDRQAELAQLAGGHSAQEALDFAQSLLEKAAQRGQPD